MSKNFALFLIIISYLNIVFPSNDFSTSEFVPETISGSYSCERVDSTSDAEFIWDTNRMIGYFAVVAGDKVANRFTALHACSLFSVELYVGGTARIELHIWGDFSGYPDTTVELITPKAIDLTGSVGWRRIELTDTGTGIPVIQPLRDFHVGFVVISGDPHFYASANNTPPIGHLYRDSTHLWYYIVDDSGRAVPFRIRAYGKYFDIRTSYWFTDVTSRSNIRGGSHISIGDMDGDGWEDFLINGKLWYNNRNGTFSDLTTALGLVPGGRTTFWDFDNDGDLDIIQLMGLGEPDRLWRNDFATAGRFTDVTSTIGAAISDTFPSASPGIGDFDRDGDLDIYIANSEVWTDTGGIYFSDFYYINEGSTFVEAAESVGMGVINNPPYYYGRIVVTCDFDEDGDLDIYVGNYRLLPNWLFVNNGDGTFTEQGYRRRVAGRPNMSGGRVYYGHTIGAQWVDVDNDGDWDLFTANLAHPRYISFSDKSMLYINDGPPSFTFRDRRDSWGIEYYETHSSCVFGDFDNDGWQDLFISCMYDGYHSFLYRNCRDHFELVNYEAGIYLNNSWGAAWVDYDHDGDLDLIARHQSILGTGMHLFRNEIGNRKHWVQFFLKGVRSDKFAVGSVVKLYCHELGFWQMRQVDAVVGTEGTSQGYILHFGLDTATIIDTIIVYWMSSGEVDTFTNIRPNRRYTIIEGVGIEAVSRPSVKPDKIDLLVYPNPFNDRCVFEVFVPSDNGELTVYSLDGRIILSKKLDYGQNIIEFDAYGLTSGVYMVCLRADNRIKTKKLFLVK